MTDPMMSKRRDLLVGLLLGLALFLGSALLVKQGLVPGERATFVAINSLPNFLYVAIWPFMPSPAWASIFSRE